MEQRAVDRDGQWRERSGDDLHLVDLDFAAVRGARIRAHPPHQLDDCLLPQLPHKIRSVVEHCLNKPGAVAHHYKTELSQGTKIVHPALQKDYLPDLPRHIRCQGALHSLHDARDYSPSSAALSTFIFQVAQPPEIG
jgi:hypothetical protein